jgi:methylase of polypeptide subunit release factors
LLALVGGLEVYERLATEALRWLGGGGVLAVEIAAGSGPEVARALEPAFMDVHVRTDLAGRDRVVVGRRP